MTDIDKFCADQYITATMNVYMFATVRLLILEGCSGEILRRISTRHAFLVHSEEAHNELDVDHCILDDIADYYD